jgi:hypothetical protein
VGILFGGNVVALRVIASRAKRGVAIQNRAVTETGRQRQQRMVQSFRKRVCPVLDCFVPLRGTRNDGWRD